MQITTRMLNLRAKHPDFFLEVTWDYGLLLGIKNRLGGTQLHADILTIEHQVSQKRDINLELELRYAVHKHYQT